MFMCSIDPSSVDIGIAILKDGKYVSSYTFRTDKKKDMVGRLREICTHFIEMKDPFDKVLVEQPDTFIRQGLYGLKNVLPIQMLMMAIGGIVGVLGLKYEVEFVRVSDWKGRQNKKVAQLIAFRETGKRLNTHESDAYVMAKNWLTTVRFKNAIRKARGLNYAEKEN